MGLVQSISKNVNQPTNLQVSNTKTEETDKTIIVANNSLINIIKSMVQLLTLLHKQQDKEGNTYYDITKIYKNFKISHFNNCPESKSEFIKTIIQEIETQYPNTKATILFDKNEDNVKLFCSIPLKQLNKNKIRSKIKKIKHKINIKMKDKKNEKCIYICDNII
jgi:hypothetical protein